MSVIAQKLSIPQFKAFKLALLHPPSRKKKKHVNATVPKLQLS